MKIVSWNVNGLNNILSKTKQGAKQHGHVPDNTLYTLVTSEDPDIICLQEVRCQVSQKLLESVFGTLYPYIYTNVAISKKGYSGTAVLSKISPVSVKYNMEGVHKDEDLNDEGRIIRVDYPEFALINVYTPHSKPNLERLGFRYLKWEAAFRNVVESHSSKQFTVVCGDLNVAHTEIDLHSPQSNHHHAGFTQEERTSFSLLLHNLGMIDAFRVMHPRTIKYSWWSNFHNSRANNKGWRIDYFVVSKHIVHSIKSSDILTEYHGSDHAPITLVL